MRRGFTLVELMIAGALLLVVLGVLAVAMRSVGRNWARAQKKAAAQSNAALALSRLREEFRAADPDSVRVGPGQVTFVSSLDRQGRLRFHDLTGALLWQKRVALYRVGGELRYQETFDLDLDPVTPDEPLDRVPQPQRADWLNVSHSGRVVARGLTELTLGLSGGRPPLQVAVEAEQQGVKSRLESALTPALNPRSGSVSQTGP